MKHKIVKSAVICLLVSSMLPIRPCEVHASATNTAGSSASVNAASEFDAADEQYQSLDSENREASVYVDFSDDASLTGDYQNDFANEQEDSVSVNVENKSSEELHYVDFSDEASVEQFNEIEPDDGLPTQYTGILTDRTTDPPISPSTDQPAFESQDRASEQEEISEGQLEEKSDDQQTAAAEEQQEVESEEQQADAAEIQQAEKSEDQQADATEESGKTPMNQDSKNSNRNTITFLRASTSFFPRSSCASISWRFQQADDVRKIVTEDTEILTAMKDDAVAAGSIRQYGVVHVLSEEEDGWHYVESGNVRGFIRETFLDDAVKLTAIRCEEARKLVAEGKDRRDAMNIGKPAECAIDPSENEAFLYKKITYHSVTAKKKYGLVTTTADPLNLRCVPGTAYEVLAQIPNGGLVYILAEADSTDSEIREKNTEQPDQSENDSTSASEDEDDTLSENEGTSATGDEDHSTAEEKWLYVESGNIKGYVCATYVTSDDETQERVSQAGEASFPQAHLLTRSCELLAKSAFDTFTSVFSADSQEALALDAQLSRELQADIKAASAAHLMSGQDTSPYDTSLPYYDASTRPAASQYQNAFSSPEGTVTSTISEDGSVTAETALDEKRKQIVTVAASALGCPYVWGGNDLYNGCDCSGFTQQVYQRAGISLPRTAQAQAFSGTRIPVEEARPGDLIFYASDGYIHHAAIYVGKDASGVDRSMEAYGSNYGIIETNAFGRDECWACTYL